jgi:hypothetical protein
LSGHERKYKPMRHERYLAGTDSRYSDDQQMLGEAYSGGPGYHSHVAKGTWVHSTRESLDYALALLQTGEPARAERAAAVIRKVLTLQDTDPTNPTYGIWPWLLEEPLEAMAPPDWNWADFCGARLAQMLIDHASALPDDLQTAMRASLGHAAWSIFRRNVGPGYTNIAIMGAGVTVAVGEILNEPRLVDYGRRRFRRIVELAAAIGGFTEYNSPTYTLVALHECERTLHLVRDASAREDCEWLRRLAWRTIAEHFHPGTQQWAGPNSRAYSDWLGAGPAHYLSEQTGVSIAPHSNARPGADVRLIPALPCPPELVERFRALPEPEVVTVQRCTSDTRPGLDLPRVATTWFTEVACLGSVSRDNLWTQRRVLSAYWRTGDDPAVVLRLRFLHDGQDFASAVVRNAQDGPRVLSVFGLLTDRGDFHGTLDRPQDGLFSATDFRVRYELTGVNTMAEQIDEHTFAVGAGDHRAWIHTSEGRFGSEELVWEAGAEGGRAWVDGVCYRGTRQAFDLSEVGDMVVTAGLELLSVDQSPSKAGVAFEHPEDGTLTVMWLVGNGLHVTAPTHAEPY